MAYIQPCPAARVGREQIRVLDEMMAADRDREPRRRGILFDRLTQLEEQLTWQRATSLEGALHVLFVAAGIVHDVADFDHTEEEVQTAMSKISRCLYSIQAAIASKARIDAAAAGGHWYLAPELDPFLALGMTAAA